MKPALLLAILALSPLAGCSDDASDVRHKWKEAYAATRDYTFQKKSQFIADMKSNLSAIDIEIDRMRERAAKKGAAAGAKIDEEIASFKERSSTLHSKLDDLGDCAEDKWDSLRDEFHESAMDLRERLQKAYDDLTK